MALRILEPILRQNEAKDDSLKLGMAELYLELDNINKARELALPVLRSKQPNLEQAYQWSNLLLKLDEFDQALTTFDEATISHRRRAAELDTKTKKNLTLHVGTFH